MEIKYDKQANVLAIDLIAGGTSAKTVQVNQVVNVDFDANGDVISIEFLEASRYVEGLEQYAISDERFLSVQEMADMHKMSVNNIQIILRQDQDKPESERRIHGAFKEGDERRGSWRIPIESAKAFIPDKRGRKASPKD